MKALDWGALNDEQRILLATLAPKRLLGRNPHAAQDVPPEAIDQLRSWWRDFKKVYEKWGRQGLLNERDALQKRLDELTFTIRRFQKAARRESQDDRASQADLHAAVCTTAEEADDIGKQIDMIEAFLRYGPHMLDFIEDNNTYVKEEQNKYESRRANRAAAKRLEAAKPSRPRDPMRWEQTAIGLYAYLEHVEATPDYPASLTGEFGLEKRAKKWIKGSTSTKQTRRYLADYGYQKGGGVPSLHNALRVWIVAFSEEMGEEPAILIHHQIARKKLPWPGLPQPPRPEIREVRKS